MNPSVLNVRAEALYSELVAWRRDFHQYPELSFQEKRTSEKVIEILNGFGAYQIHSHVGGCGVVATLTNGEGPTVGIRADMDALPIQEQSDHSFVSRHDGVMHACGHDAHTAILLGTAKILSEIKQNFQGTIKLIFQPAEEACDEKGESGAVKILQSGLLDDMDRAIALHMCPWQKRGTLQLHDGPSMANNDEFELVINGRGGHGGYPHHTIDPIWLSTYVLQAIYSLTGRKVDPLEVGTISAGQINGGEAHNIIPNQIVIKGTIRSYEENVRLKLHEELKNAASLTQGLGGSYKLNINNGEPALLNHPFINRVIEKAADGFQVVKKPFGMGSEDFSYITEKLPAAMFFLGCGLEEERSLHHPKFDIDEKAMIDGTAILVKSALYLLTKEGGE
ncbi:M20 family metallopeptidase [Halobacillus sp. A5]|uniref:M20 metallopeptidase family protein n=1 Tax=Halobacillus sp. A5 TaxID=2880263 RepID=UPI0020A669E7|nr:amidohydrolase [Halobacillus sp. A5]MCP3027326.1 amidohydrolase [Halobacillus sp. A5]